MNIHGNGTQWKATSMFEQFSFANWTLFINRLFIGRSRSYLALISEFSGVSCWRMSYWSTLSCSWMGPDDLMASVWRWTKVSNNFLLLDLLSRSGSRFARAENIRLWFSCNDRSNDLNRKPFCFIDPSENLLPVASYRPQSPPLLRCGEFHARTTNVVELRPGKSGFWNSASFASRVDGHAAPRCGSCL